MSEFRFVSVSTRQKDPIIRDTQTKTITKMQTIEKGDRNTIIEMISKEAKDFAARTVEDTVQDF